MNLVVSPGFEPRLTGPKPVVLPLHHETIHKTKSSFAAAKIYKIIFSPNVINIENLIFQCLNPHNPHIYLHICVDKYIDNLFRLLKMCLLLHCLFEFYTTFAFL